MSAVIVEREQRGPDLMLRVVAGHRVFEVMISPVTSTDDRPAGFIRFIVPGPHQPAPSVNAAVTAALADIERIVGATVVLVPVTGTVNAC